MKKLQFYILPLIFNINLAQAYTECPPMTITKVWADVGGNFYIATGGYLNGMILPNTINYSQVTAIALTARTTGQKAMIRYVRDDVTCGSAAWNEAIYSIAM